VCLHNSPWDNTVGTRVNAPTPLTLEIGKRSREDLQTHHSFYVRAMKASRAVCGERKPVHLPW
jgi:hypothetical protein